MKYPGLMLKLAGSSKYRVSQGDLSAKRHPLKRGVKRIIFGLIRPRLRQAKQSNALIVKR
jgi:hypothetical protein